jgi:hypothetical protein
MFDVVRGAALAERRLALVDAAESTAELEDDAVRPRRRLARGVLDERVDRVVGERRQLDALPVAVPAVRHGGVEHRLQRQVGLGLEQIDDGIAEPLQRPDEVDPGLDRPGVAGPDHHDRLAVDLRRQERRRRRHAQLEEAR